MRASIADYTIENTVLQLQVPPVLADDTGRKMNL